MPIHLAPTAMLLLGGAIKTVLNHRNRLTCRICRKTITGQYLKTKCCGQPLCSESCLKAWQIAGGNRCIFHS